MTHPTHRRTRFARPLALALLSSIFSSASAEVHLSPLFTPGMVIQRDAPMRVFGTATAGEKIKVTFGKNDLNVVADKLGKWQIQFPPQAGTTTAQELSVEGSNQIKVKPVWVGDVYVAAGGNAWQARGGEEKADLPAVSIFTMAPAASYLPRTSFKGSWDKVGKNSSLAASLGQALAAESKFPVGVIVVKSDTAIETWIPRPLFEATPAAKPIIDFFNEKGWKTQVESVEKDYAKRLEAWKKTGNEFPLEPENKPTPETPVGAQLEAPAVRYNAMIAPLSGLPIRSLIWAHGDSDVSVARAAQYAELLPVAIAGLRENFKNPKLPIVIVQNGAKRFSRYDDRAGAELREGQWNASTTPNTATIVTYDLGYKKDATAQIAQRVADILIKREKYPSLQAHQLAGNSISLKFQNTGGGIVIDGEKLKGVALKDGTRRWVWADGVVKGNELIVSAPGVAAPSVAQYAWQDLPLVGANLIGKNGLPVVPFRTSGTSSVTAKVLKPGEESRFTLVNELYVEDPRLPRVALMGDSIAIGQIETLRQYLFGKANIIPGSQHRGHGLHTSPNALKDDHLKKFLLERGPFDVIQFNMGVHEFGGATNPEASSIPYGERLRKVVQIMRENNPKAKIIWVSSTGTRPDNKLRPHYLAGATAYNRAAAKVMKEEGVTVSDLFGLTQAKVDEYIGDDNIHIRREKRMEISEFLSKNILSAFSQTNTQK